MRPTQSDCEAFEGGKTKYYRAALADLNRVLRATGTSSASALDMRAKVYRAMGKKGLAQVDERRAERFDREFEKAKKFIKGDKP